MGDKLVHIAVAGAAALTSAIEVVIGAQSHAPATIIITCEVIEHGGGTTLAGSYFVDGAAAMLAGRAITTRVRISVQIAVYSLGEESRRPTRLSLAAVKIIK